MGFSISIVSHEYYVLLLNLMLLLGLAVTKYN